MYLQKSRKKIQSCIVRKKLEEKRGDKRYPCKTSLSYMAMGDFVQPLGVVTVHGRMLDISNTGMRFQLDKKPPKMGSILCVRVDVDFANAIVTIPILVEIKWVKEASADKYSLGGRFMM